MAKTQLVRKIYVASSLRNAIQHLVVKQLRDAGHLVYDFKNPSQGSTGFGWSKIDPNWQGWSTIQYRKMLDTPLAKEGFANYWNAMQWADTCVLVLPCGRSAHLEAGYFTGSGKELFIYIPVSQEPELMYKMADDILASEADLVARLQQPMKGTR